jgi:hypothetical protein
VAKLTRLTDSQNSDTPATSGRELYHLQFSLQVASPETFGYTFLYMSALRCTVQWADYPFEDSLQMARVFIVSEFIPNRNKPYGVIGDTGSRILLQKLRIVNESFRTSGTLWSKWLGVALQNSWTSHYIPLFALYVLEYSVSNFN